jgi:hypothetical protein
MMNECKSGHAQRGTRRTQPVAMPLAVEFTDPSLQRLWSEKYRFNISTLRLSKEKARAWATRAVKVKLQMTESEFEYAN